MDPARKPAPQGYPRPSTLLALVACTFAALLLVFLSVPSFFEPKFENHGALLFLNTLFLSAVSVWAAWLTLQGYRRSGLSEMLSAGCGFLVFGSGALVAGVAFASSEANEAVTVYNLAALASGVFHLHAALRSGRIGTGTDTPSATRAVLTFTAAIVLTGLVWAAADADLLPPFYRPGTGSTPVRLVVGSIAIALFGAAAAMRFGRPGRPGTALAFQLYGTGLLLTALGLLAVMIAPPGSVICWAGRAAKYTGSLFFLAAFLTAIRMARRKGLDLRQALSEFHLQSDEHLRALVANSPSAVISVDDGNRVYLWNPSAEALFGFVEAEVTGRSVIELLAPDDASASTLRRVLSDRPDGRIDRLELNLRCRDGALKPVELTAFASGRGGSTTSLILRDITEQRAAEREAAATLELLAIVNRCESSRELGREAVAFFRRVSGCQAAGVRVRNGLDFPYLAAEGYPEEFLPSENVLCAKASSDGPAAADSASPMLECLCGATIAGGTPSGAGCATTAGGSFWTASMGRQLSEWRGLRTIGGLRLRVHCAPQAFESMALIPLRVGEATIGLIQIADPVPERFGLEAVTRWETLAGYLAVAFGRLLSQEESRASDDRLRAFASATFEGIVFSREGRILDCNQQLVAMLGYPRNELLGKAIAELVAPEDRERVLDHIRLEREPAIVHRLVRKDGSAITVEAHGKVLGEKGMGSRCTALRDISARVRIERSLREGEEKLHLALQSARAGMWAWRVGSESVYWSPELYELYGADAATPLSLAYWENRVHPEDIDRVRATYHEHLEGRTPEYRSEYRVHHPRAGERWLLDIGRVQRDAEGRPATVTGLSMDITERKAAEQALRNSERLYRAIGESMDFGIWVCDPEGRNTYTSESFLKLVGRTQEQCAGFGWSATLHPQDAERMLAAWQECVRTGGRWDMELRFRGTDGGYHPVLSRGMPVREDSGRIVAWAGIALDIGQLKHAELRLEAARSAALREQRRLEAVMETLPVGVSIVDHRGAVLRSNSMFESIWGRPRPPADSIEDYAHYHAWWLDTGAPVQPDEWASAQALAHGKAVTGQLMRIERFDGTTAYIVNSAAPIVARDGRIVGAAVAALDISERIEAERRLKAGEDALRRLNSELEQRVRERTLELEGSVARLRAEVAERTRVQTQLRQLSRVFMDASDSIIIEDLDGKVIDMNREAERVYGYSREELIGKPVNTLFLPERHPMAEQLRARCRKGEEVRNWESLRLDKSGRTLSLLVAAFPLMDEGGRVTSIATIAKDVTLRTLMQAELQRSKERLQELSYHSITALEADRQAVSRELHDSIGGSLAAIGYALEDVETKIPHDPATAVSALQRTITHLRQTIKESKRISVNLRPLTLDDLGLLSTIDWYTGQFMQNYPHIRVSREVDVAEAEVPEPLKIVIYRVLQEALTNAARHSRAHAVVVRLKRGDGIFTLEVADDGCGFRPETLARSGDRTAGMGLKSMEERAAICGGILAVDSQPGKGTRIRVVLPEVVDGMNGPANN